MFVENLLLALTALKANKLRTFLTMLGIIIGIGAVIAIMTLGESSVEQTRQQYADMGTDLIYFGVYLSDSVDREVVDLTADEYQPQFTKEMLQKTVKQFEDSIDTVIMQTWTVYGRVYRSDGNSSDDYSTAECYAVNRAFFEQPNKNFTLVAGRIFDPRIDGSGSDAIIISDRAAALMFQGDPAKAVGQKINYQMNISFDDDTATLTKPLTVVGVYKYRPPSYRRNDSNTKQNDVTYEVYIPYLTAEALTDGYASITNAEFAFNMKPGTDVTAMTDTIKAYLESFMPADGRFEVDSYSNASYVKQQEDAVKSRNLMTTLTGAIALLVGGIGVMNIMTVSIVERTREIGTRKALGALNSDIRMQFITEAMVICLIGGFIGIVTGIVIAVIACKVQGMPLVMSYKSIGLSVLVSMAIGIFFGYYPANKAAKMDPIEALRYE